MQYLGQLVASFSIQIDDCLKEKVKYHAMCSAYMLHLFAFS